MRARRSSIMAAISIVMLALSGCSSSIADADFELCSLLDELEQPKYSFAEASTQYETAHAEQAHMWQQAGQQHMSVLGSLVYVCSSKLQHFIADGDGDWSQRERDEFSSQFSKIQMSCASVGIELGTSK